jgi:hypothetical protein
VVDVEGILVALLLARFRKTYTELEAAGGLHSVNVGSSETDKDFQWQARPYGHERGTSRIAFRMPSSEKSDSTPTRSRAAESHKSVW